MRGASGGGGLGVFVVWGGGRDAGPAQTNADELLGDEAAERVADDHRRLLEIADDPGVVVGDLVDADVRDDVGGVAGSSDGGGLVRPAGRDGCVPLLLEEIDPGLPRRGVQPEAVDENDGGA